MRGSDVELAQMVFAEIGDRSFSPIETEFAELMPGVAAGKRDMTTGLFATEERGRLVAFSRPIWAAMDGLLVRRGEGDRHRGYVATWLRGYVATWLRGYVATWRSPKPARARR